MQVAYASDCVATLPTPFETHLPGAGVGLTVTPRPTRRIGLRDTRGLHGMVTALGGQSHHNNMPMFALAPWSRGVGWGAYFHDESIARRLAGKRLPAFLYERPVAVQVSPLFRFRTPAVEPDRRSIVELESITPVCVRNIRKKGVTYQQPTGSNLCNTLCQWLPPRLGLPEVSDGSVHMRMIDHRSKPASVRLGGKLGTVEGWTGCAILEVNSQALWLLRCAEVVGFGGRCAYGFGRIRVREVFCSSR